MLFLLCVVLFACSLQIACSTPLDDYVWKADENYGWVDMGPDYMMRGTLGNRKWTGYTLKMTSQKWLTDKDFTADSDAKSIWYHYLVVIIPDQINFKQNATLWITGGGMGSIPHQEDEDIRVSAALATSVGIVTGAFFQIPNEHITFSSDPILKSRSEDAIIAFTWDHFIKDPSKPEWLVRFPMVKASVRAMDTITAFAATKIPELQLDYYTVSGASKRGWTTWLVGAVDTKRVQLIVPIVLDAIHFIPFMHHQYRAYGGYTFALADYTDENIPARIDDPNMQLLAEYEDPYYYKDRLTMPKFVINAAMDEFQEPDDTHFWWSEMPGPKHFLILPNAEHSLATGIFAAVPAASAHIQYTLNQQRVPAFTWDISSTTGEITTTLDLFGVVHEANVYYAESCGVNTFDGHTNRRDWRVAHLDNPCECGIFAEGYCSNLKSLWKKQALEVSKVNGKRVYSAKFDAPSDGRWVAYFMDIKYVNPHPFPFTHDDLLNNVTQSTPSKRTTAVLNALKKQQDILPHDKFGGFPKDFGRFLEFTTEVSIWPNTYPYPDCQGADCAGRLV
eukprot:gene6071-8360_t